MEEIQPNTARGPVRDASSSFFENLFYQVEAGKLQSFDDLFEALSDEHIDSTSAIDLDLDDQLSLLEWNAEDYDISLGEVDLDKLRSRLEELAGSAIHYMAQAMVREKLEDLKTLMDNNDLSLDQVSRTSSLGMYPHAAEREEGLHCTVYEYRGIEGGELDIDLWHYVHEPLRVYIQQNLPKEQD